MRQGSDYIEFKEGEIIAQISYTIVDHNDGAYTGKIESFDIPFSIKQLESAEETVKLLVLSLIRKWSQNKAPDYLSGKLAKFNFRESPKKQGLFIYAPPIKSLKIRSKLHVA
jgi:hypothetical protein